MNFFQISIKVLLLSILMSCGAEKQQKEDIMSVLDGQLNLLENELYDMYMLIDKSFTTSSAFIKFSEEAYQFKKSKEYVVEIISDYQVSTKVILPEDSLAFIDPLSEKDILEHTIVEWKGISLNKEFSNNVDLLKELLISSNLEFDSLSVLQIKLVLNTLDYIHTKAVVNQLTKKYEGTGLMFDFVKPIIQVKEVEKDSITIEVNLAGYNTNVVPVVCLGLPNEEIQERKFMHINYNDFGKGVDLKLPMESILKQMYFKEGKAKMTISKDQIENNRVKGVINAVTINGYNHYLIDEEINY